MANISAERVGGVIGGFYNAAFGAISWNDALNDLANLFDGSRAWLMAPSRDHPEGRTSIEDPGFHSLEARDAMMADKLAVLAIAQSAGTIIRHSEMEPLDDFYSRRLFADWLQPRDVWFGLQAHLSPASGRKMFVDISHNRSQGDFTDEQKSLLGLIAPHICRAGELGAMTANAAIGRLAESPIATLLVDDAMRVVSSNAAAHELIDRFAHVIGIRRGALDLTDQSEMQALALAIHGATDPEYSGPAGVMLVGRTENRIGGALVVSVAPFATPELFGLASRWLAAVHLRPLRGEGHGDEQFAALLCDLFKLQPSQARLACGLMFGASLRQVAAERGVTYATARTYLDQIFRQTGVRHQGALVALLQELRGIQG